MVEGEEEIFNNLEMLISEEGLEQLMKITDTGHFTTAQKGT